MSILSDILAIYSYSKIDRHNYILADIPNDHSLSYVKHL